MTNRIFIFLTLCLLLSTSATYAQEVGLASFYHSFFNGKKTANGELFDNTKLTCAHKNLPFGTMLKVTNIENDQSVIVRVNDRGPYVKGRLLDVSLAAAKKLGFVNKGTATIMYEIYKEVKEDAKVDTLRMVDTLSIPKASTFYTISLVDTVFFDYYGVKVATFESFTDAMKSVNALVIKYKIPAHIEDVSTGSSTKLYRVFLGSFLTKGEAEKIVHKTKKNYPDSYVVQYNKFK